jgi:multicomponent Na+:H+ antiporter subunit E
MILRHLFLNLGLALVWCLLQNDLTLAQFVLGYLIGAAIMLFFVRLFHEEPYFRKVYLSFRLFVFFVKELLVANFAVVRRVLAPRPQVRSGIIALPLDLKGELPITLLANMITLTPGTLSVEVSPDLSLLFVHILDIGDPQEEKRRIKDGFERYLREIVR